LAKSLVKNESSKANNRVDAELKNLDLSRGKQSRSSLYRRQIRSIKKAHANRVLYEQETGERKSRSYFFIILEPVGGSNYIRTKCVNFKNPGVVLAQMPYLFEVTAHALERLLATKFDQREWLMAIFFDSMHLFAPGFTGAGGQISKSLERKLPSTFHHWVIDKGESRSIVSLTAEKLPVIKVVTFIAKSVLRGWSRAQYNNATSNNSSWKLKDQSI
jgi:hypothetical protein